MSDTTTPALLGELREVDADTYREIQKRLLHYMIAPQMDAPIVLDHIQGCIQRVIAARGWMPIISLHWVGIERKIPVWYVDIRDHENFTIKSHQADTPAAAILAAYIEAVRAMR